MSKAAKIWLIVGICLFVVGALTAVAVLTFHHWDFTELGGTEFTATSRDIGEAFQNISVVCDTEEVEFLPSKDGNCSVVFLEPESTRISASVQDGTLLIETKDEGQWYEHIGISSGSPKITIFLPGSVYVSLSVRGSTGGAEVPSDFTFDTADLSFDTGDLQCFASVSGLLRAKTDTGTIHVGNLYAGAIDLSVTTGLVDVQSVVCGGDIAVNVTTGKTTLREVECRNFSSGGNTGSISMTELYASGTLSVERTSGDVKFVRCDAGELLVTTDTGDVSGSLLSDKVFLVKTDTGEVRVPETVTGGTCRITTDTGDINISVG